MYRSHEDRYTLIAPKLYILRRAVQLAGDYPPGDLFTAIDLDAPPDDLQQRAAHHASLSSNYVNQNDGQQRAAWRC
jgi:hypothetical protein